jgi:hypothetical protein
MRRHGFDPVSLVFGATFAIMGAVFLFGRVDVSRAHLGWVWPLPIIALGALIVLMAARRPGDDGSREREARGGGPGGGGPPDVSPG